MKKILMVLLVTVIIQNAPATALSDLAASLQPGQWADFAMPGLDPSCGGGAVATLFTYAARGIWNPTLGKLYFYGQSHGVCDQPNIAGFMEWDNATNTWRKELYAGCDLDACHAYNHLTVDSATGYLYQRRADEVLRRSPGAISLSAWQTGFVSNMTPGHASGEVYNALQWFPELNNGQGGLVYGGVFGAKYSNAALSSWSSSPTLMAGNYHTWIARAGGFVYWGGGNGTSAMYRMSATAAFSTMPDTPLRAGTNADEAIVLPHPNGTDLLLFGTSAGGPIHRFNGTSWSNIGTHQIGAQFWIGTTIPEYGVVLFLVHPGGSGTPKARVYKVLGTTARERGRQAVSVGISISPNPFSRHARISLAGLPDGASVGIFNAAGREIARFGWVSRDGAAWDAGNIAAGIYTVKVEAGNRTLVQKAILAR